MHQFYQTSCDAWTQYHKQQNLLRTVMPVKMYYSGKSKNSSTLSPSPILFMFLPSFEYHLMLSVSSTSLLLYFFFTSILLLEKKFQFCHCSELKLMSSFSTSF
jgi:hypothetical protein